ncbi:MAG: hypothetical protein U9R16_07890 [Campylobacterota bacterium]|nr:hypothetical protein [Campylobacterota bacterium]
MDRIDYIQELIDDKEFKSSKNPSTVINNYFSLVTIIIMSIAIILYVNYVVPAQKAKKQREIKVLEHQKHLDLRAKQIALSHKLNSPKQTKKEDTDATK